MLPPNITLAPMRVQITRLPEAMDLPLPSYASPGSAGVDLYAAVREPVVLHSSGTLALIFGSGSDRKLIPTGIQIAVPTGYAAFVLPRSGLALKHGIGLVNAPGLIDSDFRSEVGVLLVNHGQDAFTVTRGLRICQLVIMPVAHVQWDEVEELDKTDRNGGWGSTGL